MKTLFSLLICAIFMLPGFAGAASDIGLSISPQKFDLIIFPGDSREAEFKLKNRSDLALPISVKALPFGAEERTGQMFFEKIEPDSPSLWLEFEKPEMILDPREERRIRFSITVPLDTEPGGYYVFVYFEPKIPSFYFQDRGPKVVPVIGVPFLIATSPLVLDDMEPEGDFFTVREFFIDPEERVALLEQLFSQSLPVVFANNNSSPFVQITKSQPGRFFVSIKNNDIFHILPKGTLTLYNAFGDKVGEARLLGQTILPNKTRDFIIEVESDSSLSWNPFSAAGYYRADLNITAYSPVRGEIYAVEGKASLAFFSLTAFYFLIVFVIIMLALYLGRKRIILAVRATLRREKKNYD